ncbi:MAG: GntR family transcriptional regulator YhfZ [Culicoidibacterales bacterium]
MNEHFFQKKGAAVMQLSQTLMLLSEGDKLPIISLLQEQLLLSRGMVQNALKFLKDVAAITTVSRGQLGTYITAIDYTILQKYAVSESLFGTMPLPYSKLYEGLATAIYDTLKQRDIRCNMAYIRGSSDRISAVVRNMYQFAVVSKYAALHAISNKQAVEIAVDLGPFSYLSQHILLLRDKNAQAIQTGDRVGIDMSSIDQRELTYLLAANKEVTFIDMPGHQLIFEIGNQTIDAGVWNYDEIVDKNYQHLNYQLITDLPLSNDVSTAVIICARNDSVIKMILQKNLEVNQVLTIQKQVKLGKMIPRY